MSEYSDIVSDGKMDPRWPRQTNLKDIPHPAKSKWQGLTTDELKEIKDRFRLTGLNIAVAFRTIEAKLKEKNGG